MFDEDTLAAAARDERAWREGCERLGERFGEAVPDRATEPAPARGCR